MYISKSKWLKWCDDETTKAIFHYFNHKRQIILNNVVRQHVDCTTVSDTHKEIVRQELRFCKSLNEILGEDFVEQVNRYFDNQIEENDKKI